MDPTLPASCRESGQSGRPRWAWEGVEGRPREGREGRLGRFVDCSWCLGPHPPLESVFASQKRKGTTSGGRSRAHSLAPHRPSPVTSAVGLPGGLPCPRSGPPCAWTPSGRQCDLALHRAWPCILASVTTRGRLGAQPRIARPTLPRLAFQPHSLDFFFPPPPFCCGGKSGFPF